MAPEVIEQENGYDLKADIWSLGMTALELADGKVPYFDLPGMAVLIYVINKPSPQLSKFENWSQEFRLFINDCLQKVPELRPSCSELLIKHKKFFDKAENN